MFDLASLIIFMRLNKQDEKRLLESFYGREPSTYEANKYVIFKQYAWLNYIVMGLGVCKNFNFNFTNTDLDELPPFNEFSSEKNLSSSIDPRTDIGRFKFAVMFIKQAKIDSQSVEYKKSLSFFLAQIEQKTISSNKIQNEKKFLISHNENPKNNHEHSSYLKKILKYGMLGSVACIGLYFGYKFLSKKCSNELPDSGINCKPKWY